MFPRAVLTAHAFERVGKRLNLTTGEVLAILNAGDPERTVTIGTEQGTHRVHRLFYSKSDNYCFIAVQDERNGEVVTVLPMDNHSEGRIFVQPIAAEMAQNLILYGTRDAPPPHSRPPQVSQSEYRNIYIACSFTCPHTLRKIFIRFGSFHILPNPLPKESSIRQEILDRCVKESKEIHQLVELYSPKGVQDRELWYALERKVSSPRPIYNFFE